METKKIEISLTDFISFVNKSGHAKLTFVKSIKNRDEYEPYKDFYKPIREAIQNMHKKCLEKDVLDELLESLTDEKKKTNYPSVIAGYKKFLKKTKYEWFNPPRKDWKIDNLVISLNPELGLEKKKRNGESIFYVIKLHFKEDNIKKLQIQQIITLMEMQLRSKVEYPEVRFCVLDVRRGKLLDYEANEEDIVLFETEAYGFAKMWERL